MFRLTGFFIAAVLILGSAPDLTAGGSIEKGRVKSQQCVACHGIGGVTENPTFPHIAGQNAGYLSLQLRHFKTGERYHPIMSPVAEMLSDQDIDDLAVYFSRIGPLADLP